jgi:hypothetical protein
MALDPISAALDIGGKLIDRLWPDPTQAAKAKLELLKMQQEGDLAQITGQLEINKEEAASSSVFVAGWRPFVGWGCGFALLYAAIFEPLLRFIATVMCDYKGPFPAIDTMLTLQVLMGMLGLAGLRSFDKSQGTATK